MRSARAAFGPLLPYDFDWTAFDGRGERLAAAIERRDVRVAVADRDGAAVGYCTAGPSRDDDLEGGEIWTLFVEPDAWGRARAFYTRYGFRADGTRRALSEFAGVVSERLGRHAHGVA